MKKSKFLVALACFGLLVTGCNKPAESKGSQPTSTSGAASQPASTPASTPASSATPTSSVAPVEDKYYSVPFGEGYETATKWEKGHEYKWTFKLTKNYKKVVFAFGAQMSSSSHGDRSLYTNHEGASSSDPFESNEANDGTCRITLKVNGVQQEVTHDTYEEAGLTNTEINYYKVAEFAVNAGDVEVSMTTHAQTGYRLMLGEEVRLYYKDSDESATPITPAFEGYKVTFSGEHCKVYVYDTKDYTKTPKETNNCIAKDEEGNIVAYDPEDEQLQPQVNFKVVCDEGYSLNASNFKITGKYNKLKQGPAEADGLPSEEYFRITKVQEDLTVVITPVQGTQAKGYKMTFAATNCSVKVYIGPKNADGTNLDTAENGVYYARSKDSPYDFTFSSPQLNFEVVCDNGYEFVPTITDDKVDFITFTAAEGKVGYNKFKANADGTFNMTKIDSDLTITIAATAVQASAITLSYTGLTSDRNNEITGDDALTKLGQGNAHVTAVTASKIYSNTGSGGAYPNANGMIKGGTSSANGVITFTLDVDVSKVEIKCHDFYKKDADHPTNSNYVQVNALTTQLAPYNEDATFGTLTFELEAGSKEITITTQKRVYIQEIVLS